ncbi:MAG TPA: hypothetical protein VF571_19990 [Pyrinomonadaceae bacterium]|jgi:hypothetical protein
MAILNLTDKREVSGVLLTQEESEIENKSEDIQVIERPRICCLDLDEQIINQLKKSGANIFEGTLGSKIKVPNTQRNREHTILINHSFPTNLHEFDIVIIDLQNSNTIDWKVTDHSREDLTGKSSTFFCPHIQKLYLILNLLAVIF